MKKGVIVQASSRSNGNTSLIVSFVNEELGFDIIDLNKKTIGHFDYEFNNQNDDFNSLFKHIVSNYEIIIFATPIYWYTMSGILKVFLDRISDFLKIEKEFGRLLRGKKMSVISCGSDHEIFDGFTMPFVQSANYLGMDYLGHVHTWLENDEIPNKVNLEIKKFVAKQLNKSTKNT
ncbi:flavodoxin family protein [Changchengzhania lutea]|uniref:flavodoxin family protein n=1 Tax=Changchengzhania lutea TaxID=2049305 RepID=UPI00115EDB80|nr:flavodoxin family protein [Changchengzhania lutea]